MSTTTAIIEDSKNCHLILTYITIYICSFKVTNLYAKERKWFMKNNDVVVYTQKLAGILMQNGYRLANVSRNKEDDKKFVFYFAYKEGIMDFIDRYRAKQERG